MKFVTALSFSDPSHYLDIARIADESGWYGFALSDHVVYPERFESAYPYHDDGKPAFDADTPWADPWVSVGAMAAVTEHLHFFTNVYVLPMRNPLQVAKSVGTAAVLSNNRVALGVGVGWLKEEFDVLEQDFKTRGRRCNESIEILRQVWSGDWTQYDGQHYKFDRLQMRPAPTAKVPIYVGGLSEAAFRRVARLGDGWISVIHPYEELKTIIARLHELRKEYGRDGEPFEAFVSCSDAYDVDGFRRLEDAGVTGVVTMPWLAYGGPSDALDDKRRGLERFANDIIAKLG